MKKEGDKNLKGIKLGIESLHKHFLETDVQGMVLKYTHLNLTMNSLTYALGAHRAMPDVLAMERVFTHPTLASCLSSIPTRSPKQQRCLWIEQKRHFQRITALSKSLGKPSITSAQANRLDSLGFSHEDLQKLRSELNATDFLKVLKSRGVNSKRLREKLLKLVRK